MGDNCSRNCGFCSVKHGKLRDPDPTEPIRIAKAVSDLQLDYVIITSVTRDDLADGGASFFAQTVMQIKKTSPDCGIELLIPDFQGDVEALRTIVLLPIDVLAHNLETVPSLYPRVRPQASYWRSLHLLEVTKTWSKERFLTKSGLMLGLGETQDAVLKTLIDLKEIGCDSVTLGQYLQPSNKQLPVERYAKPHEFEFLRQEALKMGFNHFESGPLVRSSYRANNVR
jgi:lipoic acid synthetase